MGSGRSWGSERPAALRTRADGDASARERAIAQYGHAAGQLRGGGQLESALSAFPEEQLAVAKADGVHSEMQLVEQAGLEQRVAEQSVPVHHQVAPVLLFELA